MNDSRQSINSNIEVTGHKPGESPGTDGNDKEDLTPENPYNELGFGFTAYFGMLRTFICLFVLFTVIISPALFIYGRTEGLLVQSNLKKTEKAKYMLGNLGFSGSTCISQYIELSAGPRELVCLQGTLGDLYSYGILPSNFANEANEDSGTAGKIPFENGYAYCGKIDSDVVKPAARQEMETCTNADNFDS